MDIFHPQKSFLGCQLEKKTNIRAPLKQEENDSLKKK